MDTTDGQNECDLHLLTGGMCVNDSHRMCLSRTHFVHFFSHSTDSFCDYAAICNNTDHVHLCPNGQPLILIRSACCLLIFILFRILTLLNAMTVYLRTECEYYTSSLVFRFSLTYLSLSFSHSLPFFFFSLSHGSFVKVIQSHIT